MGKLTTAHAWCNGEVAYVAWAADGPIEGCVGFMVTRIHETGQDAGSGRILPTWIAFTDQSNPDWLEQDSSVWPIQQYQWRDLTLRRSRNTAEVRPIDFKVHYEIVPVGFTGKPQDKLPASTTAPYLDDTGKPRYMGPQKTLFALAAAIATPTIDVTHDFPSGGSVKATFTNGILSTQNLLRQLEEVQGKKPQAVAAGPIDDGKAKGILSTLKKHIPIKDDKIRLFLTADVLSFLLHLIDRTEQSADGELYLALYELHDPELIDRLEALVKNGKARVILSTASSADMNAKGAPPPKQPIVWDVENYPARVRLHAADSSHVHDRLFNNDDHIGHNKFAVFVEKGKPQVVMTGSTNWTETGLCTQSNNVILIDDAKIAERYLGFWNNLLADKQPTGVPLTATAGRKSATGFAANKAVQSDTLRSGNAKPKPEIALADGSTVEIFFSPNTKEPTKDSDSPTPIDLARVYSLMEHASDAIFFLTFYPGVRGEQNIVGTAAQLAAKHPDLLVQGAISNPKALPPAKPGTPTTYKTPTGEVKKLPQPSIWWPGGDESRIAMIRASAVTVQTGDLRPELLSAGYAIIHDKIIAIDPLHPTNCTVITGSHNLGYKASYQNDENLLVIRGNQALAIAYAVHVLDTYDHYVMRAKLEDERRKSLIATGEEPVAKSGGFLRLNDQWQSRWFAAGGPPSSRDYFLGK
ncbi:phospholipase D-like domain-containing protein [Rhizobium brockwellii]|uniref:phospholipase D-like domain-containing protein n=1 Tax=Rhizobium brockwellii TaxID=3019932 RepID=UPI003F9D43EF